MTFIAWLPNATREPDKLAGTIPVPLNCTVWGEFGASSLIVRVPVKAPKAVGVKVIEMVQLIFTANLLGDSGQFEVCTKSPVVDIAEMVKGTVWVFFRTTVLAVLAAWTAEFPKEWLGSLRSEFWRRERSR